MPDLKYRQKKIQEKRKKTPWREFLMEIASRKPLTFHKQGKMVSIYPPVRVQKIVSADQFHNQMKSISYSDSFFEGFNALIQEL